MVPTPKAEKHEENEQHKPESWVEQLPEAMRPYFYLIRADKPIGTWLLLWPCCWGTAIATCGTFPDPSLLATFAIGAVVMRGAGCTINDLWDRHIDKQVARTKTRPIASGAISVPQAFTFLGGQLCVGLAVLLSLNNYTIVLGLASMGLVVVYPYMKRITYLPQVVLGLAFNWGALVGPAAVLGSCPWATALPLYLGGVCWTLVYDTIYAHQDKVDDVKVGVKSTALLFGDRSRPILSVLAGGTMAGITASAALAGLHPVCWPPLAAAGAHLAWQIHTVDFDNPADCMAKFVSNATFGALVFSGLALGVWCLPAP